jgi:hypothetical protein
MSVSGSILEMKYLYYNKNEKQTILLMVSYKLQSIG